MENIGRIIYRKSVKSEYTVGCNFFPFRLETWMKYEVLWFFPYFVLKSFLVCTESLDVNLFQNFKYLINLNFGEWRVLYGVIVNSNQFQMMTYMWKGRWALINKISWKILKEVNKNYIKIVAYVSCIVLWKVNCFQTFIIQCVCSVYKTTLSDKKKSKRRWK